MEAWMRACEALPGLHLHRTSATWSVWRDSTTAEVRFQPLPKREAVKRWHAARRFERQTKRHGKQDGAIGRNGLAVLHALLFDFLNYASGALWPSYAAIARAANISESSVWRGLKRLREAGVLHWVRRCREDYIDGRFTLRQESNAYAVLPSSQWHGFVEPTPAPPPEVGTWGDHPSLATVGFAATRGDIGARVVALEAEGGGLAAALSRLGRAIHR